MLEYYNLIVDRRLERSGKVDFCEVIGKVASTIYKAGIKTQKERQAAANCEPSKKERISEYIESQGFLLVKTLMQLRCGTATIGGKEIDLSKYHLPMQVTYRNESYPLLTNKEYPIGYGGSTVLCINTIKSNGCQIDVFPNTKGFDWKIKESNNDESDHKSYFVQWDSFIELPVFNPPNNFLYKLFIKVQVESIKKVYFDFEKCNDFTVYLDFGDTVRCCEDIRIAMINAKNEVCRTLAPRWQNDILIKDKIGRIIARMPWIGPVNSDFDYWIQRRGYADCYGEWNICEEYLVTLQEKKK